MKPKFSNFIYVRFFFVGLLAFGILSCEKDDHSMADTSIDPNAVAIEGLSSEFLTVGETLEISGRNFIKEGEQTSLEIGERRVRLTPNSVGKIMYTIPDNLKLESKLLLKVMVGDRSSNAKYIYIRPSGWVEVLDHSKSSYQALDIRKAFSFDGDNNVTFLARRELNGNYVGFINKVNVDNRGYRSKEISLGRFSQLDLEMHSSGVGVTTTSRYGYFTTDGFNNIRVFGNFEELGEFSGYNQIVELEASKAVLTNLNGAHIVTTDGGSSSTTINAAPYMYDNSKTGLQAVRALVKGYGKSLDGKYYELGAMVKDPKANLVRSATSLNAWTVVDSTTTFSGNMNKAKFIDINEIVSISEDGNLVLSVDQGANWTVKKADVNAIFLKDASEWYCVSDDKLMKTTNKGDSWTKELDLPTNAVINHMHFDGDKAVLAGSSGILYVKQ
ncbi:MAG: hypothetical protein OIF50_17995 [Flavobacteriaceae bacterium]|nr:hypothetical protein [Flavobacteriaceae bacterium]